MKSNKLSVSIVIPVYNEEKRIAECLTALSKLTLKPSEIIIVDNNCTDKTIEIAKKFPGVRVIKEERQGITHARSRGFNEAKTDIIARIDADSSVRRDWLQRILQHFESDQSVVGVGGTNGVKELSPKGKFWFTWVYRLFRAWHQKRIGVKPMLYGNNCAIRRSAWQKVSSQANMGGDGVINPLISEDLDVTILIRGQGKVIYDPKIITNCHLFNTLKPQKLSRYLKTDEYTINLHKKLGNLN